MQKILQSGHLMKRHAGGAVQEHAYVMTLLGEPHLPQITGLQALIMQTLGRRDLFEPIPSDLIEKFAIRQGFSLGVFVEQSLVAFRIVFFPHSQDPVHNLAIDLGFPEDQRTNAANLQMVCVHPGFRGNALALKMNRVALSVLLERQIHEHVFATVSPYNVYNIRVLLKCGFHITALKEKYGGKRRYIVYQNLKTPMEFDDNDARYVRLEDLAKQKEILHSGRYGVALYNGDDGINPSHVIFKKPYKRLTAPETGRR